MLHVLCVAIVWFLEVRVLGFLLFFPILASVLYMFLISTNCNYTYTLELHKINSVIKTVPIHSSVDPILPLMKCYSVYSCTCTRKLDSLFVIFSGFQNSSWSVVDFKVTEVAFLKAGTCV